MRGACFAKGQLPPCEIPSTSACQTNQPLLRFALCGRCPKTSFCFTLGFTFHPQLTPCAGFASFISQPFSNTSAVWLRGWIHKSSSAVLLTPQPKPQLSKMFNFSTVCVLFHSRTKRKGVWRGDTKCDLPVIVDFLCLTPHTCSVASPPF